MKIQELEALGKPSPVMPGEVSQWLSEAAQEIEDWGGYAIQYFQDKHDLAGTIALFRKRAAMLSDASQPPGIDAMREGDTNAARNLATYAASSAVSACGEEGAGFARKSGTKPASAKQEIGFVPV